MSTCSRWVDKGVIECKQWADRWTRRCQDWAASRRLQCDQWADEGYSECSRQEDQGYERCDSWEKSCSDWLPWPLSYICDVFDWVCVAWTWVSKWICVAWTWVSKWVCKAWATIVEWFCVAWFWVLEATCIVFSWVAKLVCVAWDSIRCAFVGLWRGLTNLASRLFGRRRRPQKVSHIFVLMLENRSFDHMLGFSNISGIDAQTGANTQMDNLIGASEQNDNPATGTPVSPSQPADFALSSSDKDPGHEFHHTLEQLSGISATYPTGGAPSYPTIDNSGYVASYFNKGSSAPEKAMHVYSPEQLPILNTLAEEFAFCDAWFSSMPGPTWPNRLFVHAGSSAGLDDSPGSWDVATTTLIDGYRFDNGTIYDRLEDKCLDWLVFEGDETPQVFSLSGMTFAALQGRFRDFEDFVDSVNDPAFPASYTFIEPHYGNIMPWTPEDFTCGNSQHPLDDVTRGEQLIKDTYEAVRNSPHWENSLIIVTYDEHGGFFDHAIPPGTVHPGDSVTDNENNHNDFDFTQLGVRVPTIVISPLIPKNTIDHQIYDHTSVIRTVGELFDFSAITDRDGWVNSLTHLLSLEDPRTDTPTQLPAVAESGFRCTGDPLGAGMGQVSTGLISRDEAEEFDERTAGIIKEYKSRAIEPSVQSFMQVALRRYLSLAPVSRRDEIVERFLALDNSFDARMFIREATDFVKAYKLVHPHKKAWQKQKRNY